MNVEKSGGKRVNLTHKKIDRALEDLLISQSVKNEKSLDLGYSLQPEWCGKEERRSRAGSWGDVPCHSVSMPWHVYT